MHNRKYKQTTKKPRSVKPKMDSGNNINGPFKFTPNPEPLTEYIVKLAIKLWKVCNDKDLEKIVLQNLKYLYDGVFYKIVSMGYKKDTATNVLLKNGHCYGALDIQTNIFYNALACLFTNWWSDNVIVFDTSFTNMTQLWEYSMVEMVCLLQERMMPLHVSKREALWRIIISKFHIEEACKLPNPEMLIKKYDQFFSSIKGSSSSNSTDDVNRLAYQCRIHIEFTMELIQHMDSEAPKGFNLTRAMKSSMKQNVTIAVAAFKANVKKAQPPTVAVANILEDSQNLKNKAAVNSDDLSIFADISHDEKMEPMSCDKKQDIIVSIIDLIEDLEKQVKESQDWANCIAVQAEKKLSSDMTELKMLKVERSETLKVIKEKLVLDDTTMKKITHVENILRNVTTELEQANGYMRRLEIENAEIKAEMEAFKLGASEFNTTSLQIAKREKKALKKTQTMEKQLVKLQSEIFEEKRKRSELEKVLTQIKQCRERAEAKLKEELKATNEARALMITERLLKEAIDAKINKKMEEAGIKVEINFQRHKDDVCRLKQEISSAKATARAAKQHLESAISLLPSEHEEEVNSGRKCIVCKTNEVSVLLLPCTHQVICVTCYKEFQLMPRVRCPICLTPIQQSIRVFGGSSD